MDSHFLEQSNLNATKLSRVQPYAEEQWDPPLETAVQKKPKVPMKSKLTILTLFA